MTDIDKERERLDQLGEQIAEAEDKAHDILDPEATPEGVPRTMDHDDEA